MTFLPHTQVTVALATFPGQKAAKMCKSNKETANITIATAVGI